MDEKYAGLTFATVLDDITRQSDQSITKPGHVVDIVDLDVESS